MASSPVPYRPSPEERDLYYFGLAGTPKLIARTSCDPWIKPEREIGWRTAQAHKRYATIGQHDIVSKWSTTLVNRFIQSLRGLKWSFFVPIRIGLDEDKEQVRNHPVILLIAVEENSLSWEEGILIASECRNTLQTSQIFDVEVEIQEGRCHDLAASAELERLVDPTMSYNKEPNSILLPLLSFPGYPIAYSEDRRGEGTIGLHVKLHGDASIYGLTCRHVVSADRAPKDHYNDPEESESQSHVQGSVVTFQDCVDRIESFGRDLEAQIKRIGGQKQRWDDYYHFDETKQGLRPSQANLLRLERFAREAVYVNIIMEGLREIENKNDRRIGHLAFHPPMEFSTHKKGYLKDWALIKLDESKFVEGPKNTVFIGNLPRCRQVGMSLLADGIVDGFLSLKGEFPERDHDVNASMIVGKMGAKTGLTFGIRNEVEAIIRKPSRDLGDLYAWKMLIIPLEGDFSAPGDSGSCIFNEWGEVIGLLTSSNGEDFWPEDPGQKVSPNEAAQTNVNELGCKRTKGMDITFADPIQWVFDDIEEFTSRKVELV
ncbi:hypothetical protein K449DRAFT_445528 [Hypoxylon sp. EC38]|nr:hypothetical protein K449DRAFT_445528 [Hypoxylon sp. EC38]